MKQECLVRVLASVVLTTALALPALALPGKNALVPVGAGNDLLVQVATKAQKNAAWADCRKRYGKRLVTVNFTRTQYSCQYRAAAKAKRPSGPSAGFIASAKKKCAASGMRFLKVINNSKSGHTNIMCVR
jgi:hypothetical protein